MGGVPDREAEVGGERAVPVVDEEAMQQSLELSQRLKIESLSQYNNL